MPKGFENEFYQKHINLTYCKKIIWADGTVWLQPFSIEEKKRIRNSWQAISGAEFIEDSAPETKVLDMGGFIDWGAYWKRKRGDIMTDIKMFKEFKSLSNAEKYAVILSAISTDEKDALKLVAIWLNELANKNA